MFQSMPLKVRQLTAAWRCLPSSVELAACRRPLQESVKTKHPQLLYESKLYKILQGGSKSDVFLQQCLCVVWHAALCCMQITSTTAWPEIGLR